MKQKMMWVTTGLICAFELSLGVAHNGNVQAQEQDSTRLELEGGESFQCTNRKVSGTYTYRLEGTLAGVGPVAVIGTFTQSNDGLFIGRHHAISFNGQIALNIPYRGTFSVDPDCTGSGAFTDVTGLKVTFRYVVMDRGREIHFLNTDAGNVLHGVAKTID
jgi:hypothetical protein